MRSSRPKPASATATRAATTPRIYAHALPLTDTNIVDAIDQQLDQPPPDTDTVPSDPIDDNTEST